MTGFLDNLIAELEILLEKTEGKDKRTATVDRISLCHAAERAFDKINMEYLAHLELSTGVHCVNAVAMFRNVLIEEILGGSDEQR